MLQKHASTTAGSSPVHSSAGLQIRPIPGTVRSAGSSASSPQSASSDTRVRKAHSLRQTIAKTVGTFLEAHRDRQKEEEKKHLSEPALRPLLTAAILQHENFCLDVPAYPEELQVEVASHESIDILGQLIKDAVTNDIHQSSLLSLRGEAAADTLHLMQQMLDHPVDYGIQDCRYAIRRLLIRLSREARILPSSLFLTGVVCQVRESVNGGAFADIYRASFGGTPVALKRLRVFRVIVDKASRELNAAFFREALVWRQLRHPHILPFWGIDRSSFRPYLCMVSPYMENGNILQCIDKLETDIPREPWLLQIGRGLEYLHQEHIVHGDLRGVNILIDETLHVRLSDFGLSILVDANPMSAVPSNYGGMGRWSAPELLSGSQASFKSDIWSFACVCIEIYTLSPPFAHLNEMQVLAHIMQNNFPRKPSPHTGIRQYLLNLLDHCLDPNPTKRPDAISLVRILSRCGPVTIESKTTERQKPLPARPTEDHQTNAPATTDPHATSGHEKKTLDSLVVPLDYSSDIPSQYLTISPISPLSMHSFVMVPSTPSSNSQDSHIFQPTSPSTHSQESHFMVLSSPSIDSHRSHSAPLSPPSSVTHHSSSDASSGYDMLSDSPEP